MLEIDQRYLYLYNLKIVLFALLLYGLLQSKITLADRNSTFYYDLPEQITIKNRVGGWSFTIIKNNGFTQLKLDALNLDLTYKPWGVVLFEFGVSNTYHTTLKFNGTRIVYADDEEGVLVVETWARYRDTNQSITWIFWRDRPYFYVDFAAEFFGSLRVEGEGWEICIFNRQAQELAALDYLGKVRFNATIVILADWRAMGQNKTFPWIVAYNKRNGAAVASILLYAYPPVGAAFNHADGAEVQYVFTPYLVAGRPRGSVRAGIIVYPHVADTQPRWLKTHMLSRQLYSEFYVDESYSFLNWTQVAWYSVAPYQRFIAYNPQGKIDILYTRVFGASLHTSGCWSSSLPRPDALPFFSPALLGVLVNSSGTFAIDLRRSPDLAWREAYGSSATGWMAGSAYGFKVNVTITTWEDSDKFLVTISWVAVSNVSVRQLYIPFYVAAPFGGNVVKTLLNETFVDYAYRDPWQGCQGVLVGVIELRGSAGATFDAASNRIYIVNGKTDRVYPVGTSWRLTILVWPHYGKLNSTNDITPLHSIQRKSMVVRNHLFVFNATSPIAYSVMPLYAKLVNGFLLTGFYSLRNIYIGNINLQVNTTLLIFHPKQKIVELLRREAVCFVAFTVSGAPPFQVVSNSKIQNIKHMAYELSIELKKGLSPRVFVAAFCDLKPSKVLINSSQIPELSLDDLINRNKNGYAYSNGFVYVNYYVYEFNNIILSVSLRKTDVVLNLYVIILFIVIVIIAVFLIKRYVTRHQIHK
jgi:hypothetical protein